MTTGRRIRSLLSATLLASAGVGLGWLDWQLASLPVDIPNAAALLTTENGTPAAAASPLHETAAPDFESFLVIAERPLFSPGRRVGANEPAPSEVSDVTQDRPQWQLSGVMLRGDAARALLTSGTDQPASWVRQDDEVSGWRVVRIDSGGVLLRRGEDEQLVDLYPDQASVSAPSQ